MNSPKQVYTIKFSEPVIEVKPTPTLTLGVLVERTILTIIASAIFWPLVALAIRVSV